LVDDSQVQKATATVEQSKDEVWLVMGCLTAVASFARDLKFGESRAALMKRLQVGLIKDDIGVPDRLAKAIIDNGGDATVKIPVHPMSPPSEPSIASELAGTVLD
jgi:hypothetical protein